MLNNFLQNNLQINLQNPEKNAYHYTNHQGHFILDLATSLGGFNHLKRKSLMPETAHSPGCTKYRNLE